MWSFGRKGDSLLLMCHVCICSEDLNQIGFCLLHHCFAASDLHNVAGLWPNVSQSCKLYFAFYTHTHHSFKRILFIRHLSAL